MSYSLGKSSLKNMEGVHPYIQMIIKKAIKISKIDFGIIENGGLRTSKMQNDIYKAGNSKCDGYIKKSYHQSGKAVDLIPYINKKYSWNNKQAFIDIINAWNISEKKLKNDGVLPYTIYFHHGIFWNWKDIDHNGIMEITDHLGWDCAHHEMRNKHQKI